MVSKILEIEKHRGHNVSKKYLKSSKNSTSGNSIRAPKYPFFNKELKYIKFKIFGSNFSYLIFEAVNY